MAGTYDFIVVGSGIAGAGVAYELGAEARVLLVEAEHAHGYHTTGRSAALYAEGYGNAVIRGLTSASRGFFETAHHGFCDYPVLTPRGCLFLGRPDQQDSLDALAEATGFARVDAAEVLRRVPALRASYVGGAVFEPGAMDVDVDGLHQGFLRGAKMRGVDIRLNQRVEAVALHGDHVSVRFVNGELCDAGALINAAGAWADEVAASAGVRAIGLHPLRRTAVIVDPPGKMGVGDWPAVIDVDEQFYFKPEAGKVLASPADETPSAPCDAFAEEMDIAICIDRLQAAADIDVRRIVRSWAGLRSFVADRSPVIGYDDMPGFFWLAGQGGYGVQTAPAAARAAAALALGRALPADIAAAGVTAPALSPRRLSRPDMARPRH
ncbi:FAD-binding oxidoreductase [Sphingomonas sp. MMSM20]|uniref:NAD(P)/FAD-dependent oxidoreductase n=1 Tax=Sphingomonas lycopersici TaxID=2951807 RepID=UPI0022390846|nr:FAD-dependent oxidoreductase [Sphingomonas lycopersici]MCW6532242.1 FAD-binding oxidoreductase [Sphingomonas lycopersici]